MMRELKSPDLKKYQDTGNVTVISLIPSTAKKILDVGCGSGDNAKILLSKGKKVDCITISEEEMASARNFCSNIYIQNLEDGLPDEIKNNKYDVVICSHVLEHIAYPSRLLNDIKQIIVSNESSLIVALPNFLSYKNRARILCGKFEYEKSGIMDYTHLRWYTYKSGGELLIKSGFEIVDTLVDGNIPLARVLKFLPNSVKSIFKKLLFAVSPGLFGGQFIYTCKFKNDYF